MEPFLLNVSCTSCVPLLRLSSGFMPTGDRGKQGTKPPFFLIFFFFLIQLPYNALFLCLWSDKP